LDFTTAPAHLSDEERAVVEEESAAVRLRAAASEAAGAMTADRNDLATDRACMYVRLRKLVGSKKDERCRQRKIRTRGGGNSAQAAEKTAQCENNRNSNSVVKQ